MEGCTVVSRCFLVLFCLVAAMSVIGCRNYAPEPLDPQIVHAQWHGLLPTTPGEAVDRAMSTEGSGSQEFSLQDGISLHEAEATALVFNPDLQVLRAQLGVISAESAHVGRWEDPEAGFDVERVTDGVEKPWLIGSSMTITVPLSGQFAVGKRLAARKLQEHEARILGAEWALLSKVQTLWARTAVLQTEAELHREAINELNELVRRSVNFREAGLANSIDERRLKIQLINSKDALARGQAEMAEVRFLLLATMGLHPDHNWRLIASMNDFSHVSHVSESPSDTIHPSMKPLHAAYLVAEGELELEFRKRYPDLQIGLGPGREDGQSRISMGLGLLPIPTWNANRKGIAQAMAERAVARRHVEAAMQELISRRTRARDRIARAEQRLTLFLSEYLPLVDEQVKDAQRLGTLGKLDLSLLAESLEQKQEASLQLLEARGEKLQAELTLSNLLGPQPHPLPMHDRKASQ